MVYSIILKSELEGALRLDAEYYQPEYLDIAKSFQKLGFLNFKDNVVAFGSGKNLCQTEDGQQVPFIRTQNVRPIIIDENGLTFTKEKNYPKLDYGDLLFVRVGEGIGDSSVVTKSFKNATFSDNVIRVKIKEISPFYVAVLLNSKVGFFLMNQIKKGSARSLISKENLNALRIPIVSNEQQIYFEEVANQVDALMQQAIEIYSQAERILLKELELDGFEKQENLFSIVKFSDIKKFRRMDAEYFQPKYEKLISRIKQGKHSLLGDLVVMKKGIEIGAEQYQESGKVFIRVSSLSKQGIGNKDQKYLSDGLYQKLKADFEPKIGEILLTKDATPGIAYVLKEKVEGIISSGILRLKLKQEIETEYLALFISSVFGQMQAERDAGGSIISHWKPEQVKNLIVPVLSKPTQQRIANLVQKSHQARQKAKELLQEAKNKVENLIKTKS